jgi:dihydroorotate dehydrogenase (NAD+) catalytic subunit
MSTILKTQFAGIDFKNPVVLASGTCGFGKEYN